MSDSRGDRTRQDGVRLDQLEQLYEVVFGARPDGLAHDEAASQLRDALVQIRAFVRCLAEGDVTEELDVRGPIAGSLKSLCSSLKHMTWQAKEIAAGDLSQRIDFLGDFSVAFNEMAERLGIVLSELRTRECELSDTNVSLLVAQTELVEQASHDPLTRLLNRRSLAEQWAVEAARSNRLSETITVMVADLDSFKCINDQYGHEAGDTVLVSFARSLIQTLRASDIACRLGGDEFAMLLPGTTLDRGALVAERILCAFEHAALPCALTACAHTASIGLAEYPSHGSTLQAMLGAADAALYRAKGGGGNRIAGAE